MNLKVKCIQTKEFNLTEGKIYDILKEKNGAYLIANDNDKQENFSHKLFHKIVKFL